MLEIKVIPQSGQSKLILDKSGQLKCFIKSAPEKGKANKEVVEVVAQTLNIAKREIEIAVGYTGRKKLLKIITNMTYDEVLDKLGSGSQKTIV